jgi:hydroxyacylglutathione hydrolase
MKIDVYNAIGELEENSYILTDEVTGKQAVIDPDFKLYTPKIDNLCMILLTHAHYDHIKNANSLRNKTSADICIYADDASSLADPKNNLSVYFDDTVSIKADVLLVDNEDIILGNEKIKVIYTPGHTKGSCCYLTGKYLFSGDTLMNGAIGRTDLPTGSPEDMIHSMERLYLLQNDIIIYPGHGDLTSVGKEKMYNPYFRLKGKK